MTEPNTPERDPLSELKQLWIAVDETPPVVDRAALERSARRLRRRVWARNASEWGAAILLLPLCAQAAVRSDRWGARLGLLCIALAGLYISAVIYQRGHVRKDASTATGEFLQAHVAALAEQATLLESVWRWYLAPFLPGITLVYVDAALAALAERGGGQPASVWLTILGGWLLTGLVFVGIGMLNRRGARGLRREIAALSER